MWDAPFFSGGKVRKIVNEWEENSIVRKLYAVQCEEYSE